ncbi:hypothetical protein B0H16DRAFT_114131 [Mycena metata]|uniref:F-box domain-containing protein n=1 Tax=Mycena metata TaxID=1033252 RepID=A0AAD7JXI4_9AGAR|nr:hypothetical protein B0H16DRAFT_114131 [Mycena metata]
MSCLPFSRVSSAASPRRATIDAQLAELSRQVALLKSERNSLAPISALPNELLVRILAAFTAGTRNHMRSPSSLARLMLVCRHWSNIIGAFPSLWDEITVWSHTSMRSLAAQLLRSGGAPIKIYILSFYSLYTPLVLANAARIKALDLGGNPGDLAAFMQNMQEVDFPSLSSLALAAHEADQSEPAVHLHRDLLGRMPSLCHLSLRDVDAPWQYLPPLRSLRLSVRRAASLDLLPLAALFNLLQCSPDLHTLKLEGVIDTGSVNSSLRADLPHLKLLHLSETLSHCEELIDRLNFPASARLQLCPRYISNAEDLRHILVPIRNHLRAPLALIATTMELACRVYNGTHCFQAATYLCTSTSIQPHDDALFVINASSASAVALCEIMDKVFTAIPTHTITHLDVTMAILAPDTWKFVFALLPGIQTVRIGVGAEGKGFCDGVVVAGITLHTVNVLALLPSDEEKAVSAEEFLDALMRMLRHWDSIGKRLARLHFDDFFRLLEITGTRGAEIESLVDTLVVESEGGTTVSVSPVYHV